MPNINESNYPLDPLDNHVGGGVDYAQVAKDFDKGEGAPATSRKRPGQGSGRGERPAPRPSKIAKSLSQVAARE